MDLKPETPQRRLHGTAPAIRPALQLIGLVVTGLLALAAATPALARGDKVIPQVADGAGLIKTKIEITSLSPNTTVNRSKLYFYHGDATPWIVETNLGTSSEFLLDLGHNQTMRVETLARAGQVTAGYAIIRDGEDNGQSSLDYQIGVSVFYEIFEGSSVVDTVSVPLGEPTTRFLFPVEIDQNKGLQTGFALVNLSDSSNHINFRLLTAVQPTTADASNAGTVDFTMGPRTKIARFLSESDYFPKYVTHKGVLVGTSEKPVAVLGLLQTRVSTGVQYATLTPQFIDAVPQETYSYLPENMSLDADAARVPFSTTDDGGAADVWFHLISPTVHYMEPKNGATLSELGIRTTSEINAISLEDMRALVYQNWTLDMTDVSRNFVPGFAFALKTSQGRYAKVRVDRIVTVGEAKHLVLQVWVYR